MSPMTTVLMLASLVGCVTFFLPFASNTSPLMAIQENVLDGLFRLAFPFLIPFVAMIVRATQMQRGPLGPTATKAVYGWVIVTLLVTLSLYAPIGSGGGMTSPNGLAEWLAMLVPIALMVYLAIVWRRNRNAPDPNRRPMLALRIAYLPNALICLWAFLPGVPNIGAWLALGTSVVYFADVIAG